MAQWFSLCWVHTQPLPAHPYSATILQPCTRGIVCFFIEGTVRGETGRPSVTKVIQMPFPIHNSEFEGVIKQWAASTETGPSIYKHFSCGSWAGCFSPLCLWLLLTVLLIYASPVSAHRTLCLLASCCVASRRTHWPLLQLEVDGRPMQWSCGCLQYEGPADRCRWRAYAMALVLSFGPGICFPMVFGVRRSTIERCVASSSCLIRYMLLFSFIPVQ